MPDENMESEEFYSGLDSIGTTMVEFLGNYARSNALRRFLAKSLSSFAYGNLMANFFTNLTSENVAKLKLPRGNLTKIKRKYDKTRRKLEKVSRDGSWSGDCRYDLQTYTKLKRRIASDFPTFKAVFLTIEKAVDMRKLKRHLKSIENGLRDAGKRNPSMNDVLMTMALEVFVSHTNRFPTGPQTKKLARIMIEDVMPRMSDRIMKGLLRDSASLLAQTKSEALAFEKRLHKRWQEPIKGLECLIMVSEEYLVSVMERSDCTEIEQEPHKFDALRKIHARALQISREILVLLKSGYADGANARWRSIYELSVIALYLSKSPDGISERYLLHEVIDKAKRARSFMKHHKKLGLSPVRREVKKLNRMESQLCSQFGKYFKTDYGWIPQEEWPCGTNGVGFSFLEDRASISHFNPFYKLACSSLHGGAGGFFRLGLLPGAQETLLLGGPTNYGLADPLENTARSLLLVSVCLNRLHPGFEAMVFAYIMDKCVWKITKGSRDIQNAIEEDDAR